MAEVPEGNEHTLSKRVLELIVAGAFIAVSGVVIQDSLRVGASWASDGPEAGYFPFYVGLLMLIASVITFAQNLRPTPEGAETFVERTQLKLVLQVLIPTIVFVVAIGYLGIYLAGGIFIGYFMFVLGKYKPISILPVILGVPLALFVLFEIWFLVPLPKGPIETWLGY